MHVECKPYFQFDHVEHYYLNIDEDAIWKKYDKKKKTKREKKQLDLLLQQMPEKLSDSGILNNIEYTGFEKKVISKSKFGRLNQIFCERKHEDPTLTTCIAIYRDILVFRNDRKVVGVAKICFECGRDVIAGSIQNTEEFGQSGDYEKLFNLLHK